MDDVSEDEMGVEEEEPLATAGQQGDRACDGQCMTRIATLDAMLGRVEGIVKMLVGLGGLASPAERLAVEKHKRQIAWKWDVSITRAGEQAKAEAVVKAANKRVK